MLKQSLLEKKTKILKQWFDVVLDSYPADTQKFVKGQKDRFANPVGHAVLTGLEGILDELLRGSDYELDKISVFLDQIIRIRAIQDFTPSQALGFLQGLKNIVRKELKNQLKDVAAYEELQVFESAIDGVNAVAFDIYMGCREQLYDLRAKDLKARTSALLKKTGYFYDLEE